MPRSEACASNRIYALLAWLCSAARGGNPMPTHYTAIMKQQGDWGLGWIAEVPGVHGQARTKDHLKDTLRRKLREALAYYRQVVLAMAGEGYEQEGLQL
jgi:hypothetical protein